MSKKKKVNSKRPKLKIVSSSKKLSKTEQTLEMLKTINPCNLENREHEAIYDENHNQRVGTIWPWPELPQEHYLNDKTIGIRSKKYLCLKLQEDHISHFEFDERFYSLQMEFDLSLPLNTLIEKGYISSCTYFLHGYNTAGCVLACSETRKLKSYWDKSKKNYIRLDVEPINKYLGSIDKITKKYLDNDITSKVWNEKVELIRQKAIDSKKRDFIHRIDNYLKSIKKEHTQLMEG